MPKKLSDYTEDELLLEQPLYQKIEIIWDDFVENTIKHDELWDNCIYEFETYETYYTDDFYKLINFFKNSRVILGKCPDCSNKLTLNVAGIELHKELLNKCIREYHENQIDDPDAYIPDADYVMKKRIELLIDNGGFFDKMMHCTYCGSIHKVSFKVIYDKNKGKLFLQKIGQSSSLREFSDYNTKVYDNLLKSFEALEDLRKGYHLQAEGYHVGAFVYLRRVFEKFIFYKFDEVKSNLTYEDKTFKGDPMEKKILALKDYLPDFLNNNKELYSVVSAGIHSLSEDECAEYFPIIKDAIEAILFLEEVNKSKNKLIKETSTKINKAHSKIREKK